MSWTLCLTIAAVFAHKTVFLPYEASCVMSSLGRMKELFQQTSRDLTMAGKFRLVTV